METIQELSNRLEGLMSSIGEVERENKQFLTHKYLLISLHVDTELKKIESKEITSREKIKIVKLHNIYKAMEQELEGKPHLLSSSELYNKVTCVAGLVKNAIT